MKALFALFALFVVSFSQAEELGPHYTEFLKKYEAAMNAPEFTENWAELCLDQSGRMHVSIIHGHAKKYKPVSFEVRKLRKEDEEEFRDVEGNALGYFIWGYRPRPTAVLVLNYDPKLPKKHHGIKLAPLVEHDGKVYLAVPIRVDLLKE